ncbi:hypothetical protein P7K49_009041 [Saguinus oedipus]|uniref:Uncharacterized protein n=1 Tax=Saguinus oedipus TaxID=9490 RepID=A0ABQ9W015_SAGOE|nr:hypothetical protein P7K49_009041 [Saguinus oedipus]
MTSSSDVRVPQDDGTMASSGAERVPQDDGTMASSSDVRVPQDDGTMASSGAVRVPQDDGTMASRLLVGTSDVCSSEPGHHGLERCCSASEKLPQREGTGKTEHRSTLWSWAGAQASEPRKTSRFTREPKAYDAAAPALETQPQGDEEDIASRYPTLWTEQVKSRQNKTNKNSGKTVPDVTL